MPKIQYKDVNFRPQSRKKIRIANTIINEYLAQGFSLTVRQLYYQFVARDIIPNKQREYDNLQRLINDARLAGMIDWHAIVDRTRNIQKNSHWENPAEIVDAAVKSYQLDYWNNQPYRIEVWIEKDALAGVIEDVCTKLDVPMMSTRGVCSQSEVWRLAQRILINEKNYQETIIFHLADLDPSGIDMSRDLVNRLSLLTNNGDFTLKRIALNMDQVKRYNPPPNPVKLSDSKAPTFIEQYGHESWELDALEPKVLNKLINDAIEYYIDEDHWDETQDQEHCDRKKLLTLSKKLLK